MDNYGRPSKNFLNRVGRSLFNKTEEISRERSSTDLEKENPSGDVP